MTELIQTDMKIHAGDEGLQTYYIDRNRRQLIPAGTRCAYVQLKLYDYSEPGFRETSRRNVQSMAMDIAVKIWEARWHEKLTWDLAQFLVSHTTIQVVVELRVEPETDS